jgi:SM-20-related protein
LANKLKQKLIALNQQDLLLTGTGNSQAIVYDSAVRSDSILA